MLHVGSCDVDPVARDDRFPSSCSFGFQEVRVAPIGTSLLVSSDDIFGSVLMIGDNLLHLTPELPEVCLVQNSTTWTPVARLAL